MNNIDFAEENETFAEEIMSQFEDKTNWVVTVRFYSLVHYVEERLTDYSYNSNNHSDRKDNIRDCQYIDNSVRRKYRLLEDLSRDARYECIRMNDDDVTKSGEVLEEGKNLLGFSSGSSSTKYSV